MTHFHTKKMMMSPTVVAAIVIVALIMNICGRGSQKMISVGVTAFSGCRSSPIIKSMPASTNRVMLSTLRPPSVLFWSQETPPKPHPRKRSTTTSSARSSSSSSSRLFVSSTFSSSSSSRSNSNNSNNPRQQQYNMYRQQRQRASFEGVSLAPQGFWVMLRVDHDGYLPWQVTDDPKDAIAATSAEALTVIQLLSGVDMAGAILPPDILMRMIVLYCEDLVAVANKEKQQEEETATATAKDDGDLQVARAILHHVQQSPPNATVSYSQVHPWVQSRVQLPAASLDEVLITTTTTKKATTHNKHDDDDDDDDDVVFTLSCQIRNFERLSFTPTDKMLQSVLYQYSPATSGSFTSMALALRYQAPVTFIIDTTTTNATNAMITMDQQDKETDTEEAEEEHNDDSSLASDHDDNYDSDDDHDDSPLLPPPVASALLSSNNNNNNRNSILTMKDLVQQFPLYKSSTTLQQTSHRVHETIVRGFEIHKLTGALRIATERGDLKAAAKIRQALDEYDSMDDLPTIDHNYCPMMNDNDDDGLKNNVLQ